jgi:hypothetical protein
VVGAEAANGQYRASGRPCASTVEAFNSGVRVDLLFAPKLGGRRTAISTGIALNRRPSPELVGATSGHLLCHLARWVSLLLEAHRPKCCPRTWEIAAGDLLPQYGLSSRGGSHNWT